MNEVQSLNRAATALKQDALHWPQVAVLGISIAISGNMAGWNYGLAIGGWGGMLIALLVVAVLFLCLAQILAELAVSLPNIGGFDVYVCRAFGPTAAFLAGAAVAIALAVGAGLAVSFSEAYLSAWLGVGGWPLKLGLLAAVIGLQMRGASEAASFTLLIGVAAFAILVVFCLFMAPQFNVDNLLSSSADGTRSLLPRGVYGIARCVPFALFLLLGVEQAAHAASEVRDCGRSMPRALLTAIGVTFLIALCVLVVATGGTGADLLGKSNEPLLTAVMASPNREGIPLMQRVVGAGTPIAIMGTFFSLAYAGSRQIYHLAQAGYVPPIFRHVSKRQVPSAALGLVAVVALVAAAFAPDDVMVIFIFMISVSHALVIASFMKLRRHEPDLPRRFRAFGGQSMAIVALLLSFTVMASCYELQVRALSIAVLMLALLTLCVLLHKAGSRDGHVGG